MKCIFLEYEEIPNNGVGDRFSGAEGDIPISSIISSNNNEKFINFSLKLSDNSDYIIPVRNDGYVNVTKIYLLDIELNIINNMRFIDQKIHWIIFVKWLKVY